MKKELHKTIEILKSQKNSKINEINNNKNDKNNELIKKLTNVDTNFKRIF